MTRIRSLAASLAAVAVLGACDAVDEVRDYFVDAITPHERYAASLQAAGLGGTALVVDWLSASTRIPPMM